MKLIIKISLVMLVITFYLGTSPVHTQVILGGFEVGPSPDIFCRVSLNSLPAPWQKRNSSDHYREPLNSSGCGARTGDGFARFVGTGSISSSAPYREYAVQPVGLTGGVKYKVEFWVKRDDGNTPIRIGGEIGTVNYGACGNSSGVCPLVNIPVPTIFTTVPGNVNGYNKALGFYTPSVSGLYYLTIGNFSQTPVDGQQLNLFFLDDVSITPCTTNLGNPIPLLTLNSSTFCENQSVIADGSLSTDLTSYRWELWSQGGASLLSSSQWFEEATTPPSSSFVVNDLFPLEKGICYRLALTGIDQSNESTVYEDFCIEDPNVNLTHGGADSYCEGDNVSITASGNSNWMYTWSTGQSGIGLNDIMIVANTVQTQYSVTVTTTAGCTATSSPVTLIVHDNDNSAPTTNGFNNTDSYTYYAQAGSGPFGFVIPSFDAANENVTMTVNSLPPGLNFSAGNQPHNIGMFSTQSGGLTDAHIGAHTFTVTVSDNNSCVSLSKSYEYRIVVVCDFCPIGTYYEDRDPRDRPLPPETRAGQFIIAGTSVDPNQTDGIVNTGNTPVLFQAGEFISLKPGFTGGPNFRARVESNTCIDECHSCCETWSGFTFNEVPNVFTPNGDGYNDVWYISDFQHPNCAFNAQEFTLIIKSSWGNDVYKLEHNGGGQCCPFTSPSAPCSGSCVPYPHSSIFWDGVANRGTGAGSLVNADTYFWTLEIKGCGHTETHSGFIRLFDPQGRRSGMETANDINLFSNPIMHEKEDFDAFIKEKEVSNFTEKQLIVYPSPTKSDISIGLNDNEEVKDGLIEIFSLQGKLLFTTNMNGTKVIVDTSRLSDGMFVVKLTIEGSIYQNTFIKE